MQSIFSFNLDNGYINWRQKLTSTNTPIIDGNHVFTISDNGYFINIDRKSGEIIWSVNILKVLKKKKQNTLVTGFILGSGKIFATTSNGFLIVCSAESGKINYFDKVASSIRSSPVITDEKLFILTENSRILGFN